MSTQLDWVIERLREQHARGVYGLQAARAICALEAEYRRDLEHAPADWLAAQGVRIPPRKRSGHEYPYFRGRAEHAQKRVTAPPWVGRQRIRVDELMVPLLRQLWRRGLRTMSSCQQNVDGSANILFTAESYALEFIRLTDGRAWRAHQPWLPSFVMWPAMCFFPIELLEDPEEWLEECPCRYPYPLCELHAQLDEGAG